MNIPRFLKQKMGRYLQPGKVVVLYGARRVGKTTLVKNFLAEYPEQALVVSGEDRVVRDYLGSQSIERLRDFIGLNRLLVVDEAQNVPDIGLNLKLIVDHIPDMKILATGSSSFELANRVAEPLTGRKFVLHLHPIAQMELSQLEARHETEARLESRLIFGSYPEIVTMGDDSLRRRYLEELTDSYLYMDILKLETIRNPDKLTKILQLLAFQIGNEVSHTELGSQLGMSKNTVEHYLDLLCKVFVLWRVGGFSRNLRKEVTKTSRYYFCDNGVRNAIVRNFQPITLRNDVGALWENYVLNERRKRLEYEEVGANTWFWRTYSKEEIDWIEESAGRLSGYEIKWGDKNPSAPKSWKEAYPDADFQIINRANYLGFIQGPQLGP